MGVHFGGFWVGRGVLCGLLVCVYSRFDFGLGMFCVVWCYLVCFVTHRFSMVPLPCPLGLFCFVTSRLPRFHNKITPYYLILFLFLASNPHRSRCKVPVFILARRGAGSASGARKRAVVGALGGPSSGIAKWAQLWSRRCIFCSRARPFSGPENGPGIPKVFEFPSAEK